MGAFLERAPEVAGVYPVRVTYPASVSSTLIQKDDLAPGGQELVPTLRIDSGHREKDAAFFHALLYPVLATG